MIKLVRKLLKLFIRLKIIKKVYSLKYSGDIESTNDIYQSRHWSVRFNSEVRLKKAFRKLFKENPPPKCEEFGLVIFYNNQMDVCNITYMEKVFVDSYRHEEKTTKLRHPVTKKVISSHTEILYEGFVPDDTQKHFKFLYICPDKDLPKQSMEFNICVMK